MTALRVVTVVVMLVVMVTDVVNGEDNTHHNYATTRRRSSLGHPYHRGESGSIIDRQMQDAMSRNYPPIYPESSRSRVDPMWPQLQGNDIFTEDDDYDLSPSSLWQPQTRFSQRQRPSLKGLQNMLEGQVMPDHSPSFDQPSLGEEVAEDEITSDGTFVGQDANHHDYVSDIFPNLKTPSLPDIPVHLPPWDHKNYDDDYISDNNNLFPNLGSPSQPDMQVQLPLGNHRTYDSSEVEDRGNVEEPFRYLLNQPSVGKDLNIMNSNRHYSDEFSAQPPQFVEDNDDGRKTLPISGILAPGQYTPLLAEQEPLLKNLFNEGQLPASLGKEDIFSNVDSHPDYPDQSSVSDTLSGQQQPSFPGFPHHSIINQNHQDNGHFQDFPAQQENVDEGREPEWFSSPPFHLPSSKDLITSYTNPELTQEGKGEACHARNLHTCGGRVIDEFTQQPKYLEACRIREEFLDCMEEQRGRPCEVRGRSFSREATGRIRDKVKSLLWSARGCILGHSA